jgi:4-amino-4-deoxy-L-arabinose transferase-like glycosyltransferase
MTEEPTVLDYIKSLLRGKPIPIPASEAVGEEGEVSQAQQQPEVPLAQQGLPETDELVVEGPTILEEPVAYPAAVRFSLPWRSLLALSLALLAQLSLEPRPDRGWIAGLFFYLLAAAWLIYAHVKGEWPVAELPPEGISTDDYRVRTSFVFAAIPAVLIAFLALGNNRYTGLNLVLWLFSLVCVVFAFWQGPLPLVSWWPRLRSALRLPWRFKITGWALLLIASAALVIFFRVYRLSDVPPEMVSDQAEKLLDVWDVLNGQWSIFFPRNTGREDFQMYLTAAIANLFDTGISFMSLKIGTVLCGLLTLPFIYGIGKEVGGKRAALFAMLLAGVAYWPNVISRIGLRFTLYAFFTAPVLYYLIRGLRTRSRNDFILAGLFLGLGLHGYSPFRIVPVLVVIGVVLYILHAQSKGVRWQALWWLVVLALVSIVVFLPLLRFSIENPELFSYRALTRLGSVEQPLPGPAWLIFLQNMWNALVMFSWDNGEVWVVSIPGRPALDYISAALFHLGVVLVVLRYIKKRHWVDLFLLLSIPVLLLPSVLSLAFPNENPILNRTSGALVPVFVITGLALDGLLAGFKVRLPAWGSKLAWGVALVLVAWSALNNYNLVFNEYQRSYELSAWNTAEMGGVVREFGKLFGQMDTAWVVAFPYWVDTRLVGMNAGMPTRDMAIWPESFPDTLAESRPKMFLVKPEDSAALEQLYQLYPNGTLTVYDSDIPDRDFFIFLVPPAQAPDASFEYLPAEETVPGQ